MNVRTHILPGLGIAVLGGAILLAHGLPGSAQSPTTTYLATREQQLAQQWNLVTNEPLHTVTVHERLTPAQEQALLKASGERHAVHDVGPDGHGSKVAKYPRVAYTVDYRKVALQAAKRAHIAQPKLFVRQMAAESGFQPCVVSSAGAVGIAQIMPATAKAWHVDPYMPKQALYAAARHMRSYEVTYGSYAVALAAYNAGTGSVAAAGGVPHIAQTENYVAKITHRSTPLAGMRQVYHLPDMLRTKFALKLRSLERAVKRGGGHVTLTQGWRSYAEQLDLWTAAKKKYGGWEHAKQWVAPPGCSNHNRGLAADLGGDLELAHRLAPRYGLVFPMSYEPWHVELAGIATQSG